MTIDNTEATNNNLSIDELKKKKKREKRIRQKERKLLAKAEESDDKSYEKLDESLPKDSTEESNEKSEAEILKRKEKNRKRLERRKAAKKAANVNEEPKEPKESEESKPSSSDSDKIVETPNNELTNELLEKKKRKAEKRKRQRESKKLAKLINDDAKTVDNIQPDPNTNSKNITNEQNEQSKKESKSKNKKNKISKEEINSEKSSDKSIQSGKNDEKSTESEKVLAPVTSTLVLNTPMKFNASLYDEFEYFCDCCPVELTGYQAATNHVKDFQHSQMSIVYDSLNDSIKCQACGDPNLSLLNVILVNSSNLNLCCNSCLENNGYNPLIYSLSSNDTLLKYVDNLYHLISLSCFSCESDSDLYIDENLTCYCSKCIANDNDLKNSKLIKRDDDKFLSTLFEDEHYDEFKKSINLSVESKKEDPKSSTPAVLSEKGNSKNEPDDKSSKSKRQKSKDKNSKDKVEKKTTNQNELKKNDSEEPSKLNNKNSKKPEKKNNKKESKNSNKDSNQKSNKESGLNKESKSSSKREPKSKPDAIQKSNSTKNQQKIPTSSPVPNHPIDPLTSQFNETNISDIKTETKFDKLKLIIKNTLPKDVKLTFDSLKEHHSYLTYSLFLEELFSQDICDDVKFEWHSKNECTMSGKTKTFFDMYVNDDIYHLKKHPFVKNQPIFIIRKSDADLNWVTIPEFWVAYNSSSTLVKVDRRGKVRKAARNAVTKKDNQKSSFSLKLYPWNEKSFPIHENGSSFAFLPGSVLVGRILNSMNQIENKDFINLILGKNPIKMINFNNKIDKYYNVLNDSQKKALQSALNNSITILQGPPGSGKTSTIYEIILQLLNQLHYYPILVVAASNLAVDNIAEKLMADHKDKILRITSFTKEKEYGIDHPLGSICLHHKISEILPPNLKDIEKRLKRNASSVSANEFSKYLDACSKYGLQFINQANIIFATTTGIAGPTFKGIKNMPVIIMDESTQSSEPSTLIPLGAKGCKKVIFVGDTAQLSVFTRVKSLEMSLFERVLKNGTYNSDLMLDTQYRMHPDISHFPRNKFYDGKLKDGITADQRKIPNIKYPVYFFDHKGVGAGETKMFSRSGEEFGFSWVNKKEVSYIERMVEKLIFEYKIKPRDIGIMSGYAAQRDLIVKALESNKIINPNSAKSFTTVDKEDITEKKNVTVCNVNGIVIATIDAFQGREMNFVLLSCVRSNPQGTIGFMSDKRRMNVALTRAKYSFLICGDAKCLSTNKLWKEYIEELRGKDYVKNSLNSY